ncbi:putative capsular polysaccharide synthesis family protein [Hyphomonas sp.]|jgi:hypothetical protein|uniref:putative capsular polysaccharide synthesis family protein n=1 Tax=Hyphomonas sp. TaxID=87 RepID=UPI0032EF83B6
MICIVYTMGKVGSTAISRAIKAAGLRCYDIHTMKDAALAGREPLPWHEEVSKARQAATSGDGLVITVARDPVARNLSGFFENLALYAPEGLSKPHHAIDVFLEKYSHQIPTNWFQREMLGELGVDLFSQPFDHKTRLQVHEGSPRVVAFRDDTADDVKSLTLSHEFGKTITIGRERTSAEKPYGELYRLTVESAWAFLPASYLDEMYDNDYVRHFWTPAEIAALRSKWSAA